MGDDPGDEAAEASLDQTLPTATVGALSFRSGRGRQELPPELSYGRGDTISRYVVIGELGVGGGGVVYRAYDPELERNVAIKLVRSAPDLRARVFREAQALARIAHPNVIAVHDVGAIDDQLFIAMEYVSGETLRQWLAARRRGLDEIVAAFLAAGRGLQAAHDGGLVHRDFKPDNVIVGDDGRVRVVDFGLARAASDPELELGEPEPPQAQRAPAGAAPLSDRISLRTPLTRTGALLGTPHYMAPEQYLRRSTDVRTDEFSFCVALYEALYRQRPFAGHTLELLAEQVTHGLVRAPAAGARAPARFRRIVLRGLSVDPAERYPSMSALLRELSAALAAPRRRAVAGLAAVATLLVICGVAYGINAKVGNGEQRCVLGRAELAGVWDESVAHTVHESFAASGRSYSADTYDRVAGHLDRYAGEWVAAFDHACDTAGEPGPQAHRQWEARVACLDRRRHALAATTRMLAGPVDSVLLDHSVEMVLRLPAVSVCADALASSAAPLPATPEDRERVDVLSSRFSDIGALRHSGKFADALEVARAAALAADEVALPGWQAEAYYLLGLAQYEAGDADEARISQERAARLAARAGDDVMMVRALIALQIDTFYMDREAGVSDGAPALQLGPLVEVALERAAADGPLRAEHLVATGEMLIKLDRHHEALDYFEQGLELQVAAFGMSDVRVARSLRYLALALPDDRSMEAAEHLERARTIYEGVLGRQHPEVGEVLNSIANKLSSIDPRRAAEAYAQAGMIFANAFGATDWTVGRALNNGGQTLCQAGEFDEGLAHITRGLAIYEQAFGPNHCHVAFPLSALADCALRAGRPDEAVAPAERAIDSCRDSSLHPSLQGYLHFQLAQALWEGGGDQPRSMALAQEARRRLQQHDKQGSQEYAALETWLRQRQR